MRRSARQARGVGRAAWHVLGLAAAAAATGLVLLHAWIFWDQLASGRLVDPALALKWIGAGALCAALLVLRRAGIALLWGRKAFVVWLLVALLHVGTGSTANLADAIDPHAETTAVFILPVVLSPLAALGLGILLLWRVARATAPPRRLCRDGAAAVVLVQSADCLRQIPPRAPPIGFASSVSR